MPRKPEKEREFIKRKTLAKLNNEQKQLLTCALDEACHRVQMDEKLPAYLMTALERFARDEDARIIRIIARNMVLREHHNNGLPISRDTAKGETAFSSVANKLGKSIAWVDDAYHYPIPRK